MDLGNFVAILKPFAPWLPVWVLAVMIVAALLVAAAIAQHIVMMVLSHYTRGRSLVERVFRRTRGIVRFGIIIIAVSAIVPMLPLPKNVFDLAQQVLLAAFIVLIGWVVMAAATIMTDRYLSRLTHQAKDNLQARTAQTQVRILRRGVHTIIVLFTIGAALMTFHSVRQFGISIFASAGVAGIVLGLAARPVLENFIAGIQIALTQPIRIDDIVVVENEWGQVEEVNSTYITIRIWDKRRLILPLNYFLQQPFQNWTHKGTSITGAVTFNLDFNAPIEKIRARVEKIVKNSKLWDGDVVDFQVIDMCADDIQVRALVSAADSSAIWDLRCEVREKILQYLSSEIPYALPRHRGVNVPLSKHEAELQPG